MTWLELAKGILDMPQSELNKEVSVFDYNEEINENAYAIIVKAIEPWDLDKSEDYMIVFNSKGWYKNVP